MTTAQQRSTYSDVPQFDMGDRIRKARRWKGQRITQADLAAAITAAGMEISSQAVGNWESGANDIDPDRRELVAVAVALRCGVSRTWLLDGWDGIERRTPGGPQDSCGNLPLQLVTYAGDLELSPPIRNLTAA